MRSVRAVGGVLASAWLRGARIAVCAVLIATAGATIAACGEETWVCCDNGVNGCACFYGSCSDGQRPIDECNVSSIEGDQEPWCCRGGGESQTCQCHAEMSGNCYAGELSDSCDEPPGSVSEASPCESRSYTYCGSSAEDDKPCFDGLDCLLVNPSTERCSVACEVDADCSFAGLSGTCGCASSGFGCNCLFSQCVD